MMPVPFILYILTIQACWGEPRHVERCPCRLLDQLHPFLANLRARGSRRGAAFAATLAILTHPSRALIAIPQGTWTETRRVVDLIPQPL